MRVLLVKLSSLGDVIHNLPVASDLSRAFPDAAIEWALEPAYAPIARLHPAVRRAWPVPLRRVKAAPLSWTAWRDFLGARRALSAEQFDHILDTQGLVKSAWVAGWPEGEIAGYGRDSAREPAAARRYARTFEVSRNLHAVTRNRLLAARAFGYEITDGVDFGLAVDALRPAWLAAGPYAVFLHATSRANKMWPDAGWLAVAGRLAARGIRVVLPWGSAAEHATSIRLAAAMPNAVVPPAMPLDAMAGLLSGAVAVVGVDTGIAHLAVALGRPTVGIYLTTQPSLTGLFGSPLAKNLGGGTPDAPAVPDADLVWAALEPLVG